MARRILVAIVCLVAVLSAAAQQDSIAMRYAGLITEEGLREHLSVLASDAYEGREVGSRGEKMATAYIGSQLYAGRDFNH